MAAEWVPPTPPPPGPPSASPSPTASESPAADPDLPVGSGTYVVQVPKEQIYRVPPPENARLVEQYRNNLHSRRLRSPCAMFLCWLLAFVLIAFVLLLIIALVFFLVVRPGVPSFSVQTFLVKDPYRAGGHPVQPEYDITLRSRNPSARMSFSGDPGGRSVISHRKAVVATGETPGFYLDNQNATVIKLVLHGSSKDGMDKEMERGSTKAIVLLALSVDFPVRLMVGGMTVWAMSMDVACDVRVSGLAKGARVVSQECSAELRS